VIDYIFPPILNIEASPDTGRIRVNPENSVMLGVIATNTEEPDRTDFTYQWYDTDTDVTIEGATGPQIQTRVFSEDDRGERFHYQCRIAHKVYPHITLPETQAFEIEVAAAD